jgi:NADH-quinone oxidoreductase subunit I
MDIMTKTKQANILDKYKLLSIIKYLEKIATGFLSLLKGMGVTIRYFISPGKIVTQQYPENQETLIMMDRFRGHLIMTHNEDGENKCTGCGICEKACPNGTISVLTTKDLSGHKVLGRYIYRLSQCTLCNLCVESCPLGAISMGKDFELAVFDRKFLTFILNKPARLNQVFPSSFKQSSKATSKLAHQQHHFSDKMEEHNI